MKDTFRVKLIWMDEKGQRVPDSIEKLLQGYLNIIVPLYNAAANALNSHYKKWNSEYSESKDGEYEDFICEKMNSVLKETPETRNSMFETEAKVLGEDGTQICFNYSKGGWCSIILEPME